MNSSNLNTMIQTKTMRLLTIGCSLAVGLCSVASSRADVIESFTIIDPAFNFSDTSVSPFGNVPDGLTFGYFFTADTTSELVTALGVWDEGGDGLGSSHAVGLWDENKNLLASATVPSGTAGTLDNGFRYTPIAGVVLDPGKTYVLGAFYSPNNTDPIAQVTIATPGANYTLGFPHFAEAGSLTFPDTENSPVYDAYFGPNAKTTSVPSTSVPDTTNTLALSVMGLLGVALAGRRLQRA